MFLLELSRAVHKIVDELSLKNQIAKDQLNLEEKEFKLKTDIARRQQEDINLKEEARLQELRSELNRFATPANMWEYVASLPKRPRVFITKSTIRTDKE